MIDDKMIAKQESYLEHPLQTPRIHARDFLLPEIIPSMMFDGSERATGSFI